MQGVGWGVVPSPGTQCCLSIIVVAARLLRVPLTLVILLDFTVIYLCQTGAAHSCKPGESLLPALLPLRSEFIRFQ